MRRVLPQEGQKFGTSPSTDTSALQCEQVIVGISGRSRAESKACWGCVASSSFQSQNGAVAETFWRPKGLCTKKGTDPGPVVVRTLDCPSGRGSVPFFVQSRRCS